MSDASYHQPRLQAASGPSGPMGAPKPPTYSADRDVHVLDRLAILYRYRRVSAAVFVLTALVLMIQGYSNVVRYETQARLLIEDERSTAMPGMTSPDAYWADPVPYYNTQYRILRGRELARRVVRKLQLQDVPEFNGTEAPAEQPACLAAFGPPAPGRAGAPGAGTDRAAESRRDQRRVCVDRRIPRAACSVVPVPDSKLVDIFFTASDAAFAAKAANTLVDEYVTQNLEVKHAGHAEHARRGSSARSQRSRAKVEQSERELATTAIARTRCRSTRRTTSSCRG